MTTGQAGRTRGRRGLRSRDVVILLVVVLACYLVLIGARGISLLGDHRWIVKGLGIGVLLLPLVGVAIVVAELRFGRATERLAKLLGEDPCRKRTRRILTRRSLYARRGSRPHRTTGRPGIGWPLLMETPATPARGRRTMRKAIAMQRVSSQ